jgi:hypothetical protein
MVRRRLAGRTMLVASTDAADGCGLSVERVAAAIIGAP